MQFVTISYIESFVRCIAITSSVLQYYSYVSADDDA